MRCDRCGYEAPVLKTCRWRTGGEQLFALCPGCHAPIAGAVWIVPGPVACFGQCRSCSGWFSVLELTDRSGGGKWDSNTGLCLRCARGQT
jgi:hypothetical protein